MDKSPDQALKYLQSKRDPYDFLHLSTGEMISNLDDKVVNSFNKKTISFISNISKTNSLDFIPKFLKEVLFFVLSEKEKEEFNRNLAVGILPILSFNAVCRESPQPYNGYLIFLNMGFSLFCCELLKISLGVLSNKINHLEFIKFSKKLYQSYFINKKHLHCDLILDEADNKILSKLIDGINLFAFFHEYSHYSLDHLSCAKEMKLLDGLLTNLTLKKKQEKDADLNSCNLILKFYKISPQQNDLVSLLCHSPLIYLHIMLLLENRQGLKPKNHPPAIYRKKYVSKFYKSNFQHTSLSYNIFSKILELLSDELF